MNNDRTFGRIGHTIVALGLGLLAAHPVAAQELSASIDGKGSAVVVPYYTVNDNWRTLLNITNTSANSLAIKVRFLEARNGRDILNFIIALPPGDVWAGWLSREGDGAPIMRTGDRSCTVPSRLRDEGLSGDHTAYSQIMLPVAPPGESLYFDYSQTNNTRGRMSEGHIEVLVMGEAIHDGRVLDVPWNAEYENGEPRDCQAVANAFVEATGSWSETSDVPGAEGSGDPEARGGANYGPIVSAAPLKVNAGLVNPAMGTAAAIPAQHIAGWGMGQNLVTGQTSPWRFEPTLASHEGLWSMSGLDAVSQALAAVAVENEWASNPATGASTDWVLNFPTKRFQADDNALNVRAGCSKWRNSQTSGGVAVGEGGEVYAGRDPSHGRSPRPVVDDADAVAPERLCPDLGFPEVFQDGDNGRAEIVPVRYHFFDRATQSAEHVAADNAAPGALFYVTNVLPTGSGGPASALGSPIALAIDSDVLAHAPDNGWLRLDLPRDQAAAPYPMTGFVFKLRDFGKPELNFSQAVPHTPVRP